MNKLLIILSTSISVAIGLIGLIWVPYGVEATRDIIFPHYLATIACLFSVSLVAIYLIASNQRRVNESYGQIVTTSFLILSAIITIGMFAKTYTGLSYQTFLVIQILQYVVLAVVWGCATMFVAPSVEKRETHQRVSAFRKANIANDLYELSNKKQIKKLENSEKILKAVGDLSDELKYFPNSADGIEAESILRNINNWIQSTNQTLETEDLAGITDDLVLQAKSLQRQIAQYKKV